ncbi:MAG: Hsp33 family molecular chaperone HslO [Candidatus Sedimenticola sp. (ex Thyasira tokunagai)]
MIRASIENTLRTIGVDDVKGILSEQGKIQVDCGFCNKQYLFDPVDVEQLFAQA